MDTDDHPCFSDYARYRFGRIHLPVAPDCNMQCNYCRRDYDCINESRPGAASAVLTPRQALEYVEAVISKVGDISVVGIAGPGDPFANAWETMETLCMVRERYPDLLLCVATNGLELSRYIDDLAELKVSHVTITLNALDPKIGSKIYAWARLNGRIFRGVDAARVILTKQIEAIMGLKTKGIIVKINTVVIPGVNDEQVVDIARVIAKMGVDIMNCIPLCHTVGTAFEGAKSLPEDVMEKMREKVGAYLPQMNHCARCRADAAGTIGEMPDGGIQQMLKKASRSWATPERPYIAVASTDGIFVDQRLGEAAFLWIFGERGGKAELIDRRATPPAGGGTERWREMAALLSDCNTILVRDIGQMPQAVLHQSGIRVVVMEGPASEGVLAVLRGEDIAKILLQAPGCCGTVK